MTMNSLLPLVKIIADGMKKGGEKIFTLEKVSSSSFLSMAKIG